MKLSKIVAYQAIQLPVKGQANFNSISDELIPGVEITLIDQIIYIKHANWSRDVIMPTANLRYAEVAKEVVAPQSETIVQKKITNVKPKK